mmetsp:Transcript_92971/g.161586  ORF Transcript_92971/g.161586 Transcript_92971/m.161586 type:complete len:204 (-) Transcript_92971:628-1239(-)
MDYVGTNLIVLLTRDPPILEGAQRGQRGAPNPNGVLPLRWSKHLDLHHRWRKCHQLLGQALGDARQHRGAPGKHNVAEEFPAQVDVARLHRLEGQLVDTTELLANSPWMKESLWTAKALTAHRDNLTIRKLVRLLVLSMILRQPHFLGPLLHGLELGIEVLRHITEFLLDISHYLPFSSIGQGDPTLHEQPGQVLGQVSASQI